MNTGNRRRAAGIAANLSAAERNRPSYDEAARTALARCIRSGEPFTADDVHRRIPAEVEPDASHNVVPSLLGVHASAGLIRRVGAANSSRPSRHGSRNQVWIATNPDEEPFMPPVHARCREFEPKPGRPGAAVTVFRPGDGSEVTGQVQFAHPRGPSWVWVSLWDGQQPVAVQFAEGDRRYGYQGGRP